MKNNTQHQPNNKPFKLKLMNRYKKGNVTITKDNREITILREPRTGFWVNLLYYVTFTIVNLRTDYHIVKLNK